jgi:hypothetical protein
MSVLAICPHCAKQYRLSESLAGRKAKCKICGAVVTIPAAHGAPAAQPGQAIIPPLEVAADAIPTHPGTMAQ